MSSARNSAIFTGKIAHTRLAPRRREFRYPIYMLYIDLAELDSLFVGTRLFSARGRRAPAQFRRADFFGDASRPLAAEIRDLVEARTGARPAGPIRLLANMRTFGYQFNPIAVYYCFDEGGEQLTHVVADVSNIPYGESYAYVFAADAQGVVDGSAEKRMHVSPFLEMDYTYRLRTAAPDDELGVFVSNSRDGEVEFVAALRLNRSAATVTNLRRTLMRFPAIAVGVTARIFWQALRMKLGGFKWYPHAERMPDPAPAAAAEELVESQAMEKTHV